MTSIIEEQLAKLSPRERLEHMISQRTGQTIPVEFQVPLRNPLFEEILRQLEEGKLTCIIGQKQMGKSSLTARILHNADQPRITSRIDMMGGDPEAIFSNFLNGFEYAIKDLGGSVELPKGTLNDDVSLNAYLQGRGINLTDFIRECMANVQRPVIIAVSEFTDLYDPAHVETLREFISLLTEISQIENLSVIIDVHPSVHLEQVLATEFEGDVSIHRLGPIACEEMPPYLNALVREDPTVTFHPNAYTRMYEVTGGRPNEIARILHRIFTRSGHNVKIAEGPYEISIDDINSAFHLHTGEEEGINERYIHENINPYLSYLETYTTESERGLLRRVAQEDVPLDSVEVDIDRLIMYGILEVVDGIVRYRGEICRYFFERIFCNLDALRISTSLRGLIQPLVN